MYYNTSTHDQLSKLQETIAELKQNIQQLQVASYGDVINNIYGNILQEKDVVLPRKREEHSQLLERRRSLPLFVH